MSNLRDRQRRDLKKVRNDWWIPVILIAPDKTVYSTAKGTTDQLLGDVRKESKEFDPDLGGKITVKRLSIVLRIDDLTRVPEEDETWFIKYPDDLTDSGTMIQAAFNYNQTEDVGDTLGYIKVFPQEISV